MSGVQPSAATATAAVLLAFCCGAAQGVGPQPGWTRPENPMGRLYDKFFVDLTSADDCVGMGGRDGEQQCYVGQTTSPLVLVDSVEAWTGLEALASAKDLGPVTVVLDPSLTADEVYECMKAVTAQTHTRVNAIVNTFYPYANTTLSPGFSPLPVRPNNETDIYKGAQPAWNAHGLGLWEKRLPLFVLLSSAEMAVVVARAAQNHKNGYGRPWESAEFNYPMAAKGMTAEQCLNENQCDLVGKLSGWGATCAMNPERAREANGTTGNKKFVAVAVPVSGTSLYTDSFLRVPAEGAVMGGVAAALAVVDSLSAYVDRFGGYKRDVLFFFFNAELYGRAGSERFWKDTQNFTCHTEPTAKDAANYLCMAPQYPILNSNFTYVTKEDVDVYIALDQLGVAEVFEEPNDEQTFIYVDDYMYQRAGKTPGNLYHSVVQSLQKYGGVLPDVAARGFLPPSSLHPFLRPEDGQRERTDLAAVVLGGYNGRYANKYFGSLYDVASVGNSQTSHHRLNATLIYNAAVVLSNTLFDLTEGRTGAEPPTVDRSLVDDLTACFGSNASCDLITSYLPSCVAEKDRYTLMRNTGRVNMYAGRQNDPKNPVLDFALRFMSSKLALPTSSFETCDIDKFCNATAPRACDSPYEVCVLLIFFFIFFQ